jgi:hypothetical protein
MIVGSQPSLLPLLRAAADACVSGLCSLSDAAWNADTQKLEIRGILTPGRNESNRYQARAVGYRVADIQPRAGVASGHHSPITPAIHSDSHCCAELHREGSRGFPQRTRDME